MVIGLRLALRCACATAVCAALATAAPAAAQDESIAATSIFKDGDDLWAACTSNAELEIARCEWFLMGAHDMSQYYEDTGAGRTYCSPRGLTAARLRQLLVDYLRREPARRRFSASSLLHSILQRHFRGDCTGNSAGANPRT